MELTLKEIGSFILVLSRILSLIATYPLFGSKLLPTQAKVGLAFFLALSIYPIVDIQYNFNNLIQFIGYMTIEVIIGIIISYSVSILLYSLSFVGDLIDYQNSFIVAREFDPFFFVPMSITGEIFFVTFLLIFIYIGGLSFSFYTIAQSFKWINPYNIHLLNDNVLVYVIKLITLFFVIGFKLSAPILSALIVTTIILSIIARTVPQINIFIVGIPLKVGISLVFSIFSLPIIKFIFESAWNNMEDMIVNILKHI